MQNELKQLESIKADLIKAYNQKQQEAQELANEIIKNEGAINFVKGQIAKSTEIKKIVE